MLVVITSSFGDGEPPDNYTNFLLKILQAAEDGSKPLEGMQHAVLGEGSSVYQETFQNCPRLTDKYLEECGSRRFFARHETDVGGEEDEEVSRNLFRNGVAEILLKGLPKATSAAAAAWAKPRQSHGEPTDQIKVHSVESLGDLPTHVEVDKRRPYLCMNYKHGWASIHRNIGVEGQEGYAASQ